MSVRRGSRFRTLAKALREDIVRVLYRAPTEARRAFELREPPLVRGPRGLLRVHVGCGGVALPGWFNVDERWFPHVHHVGRVDRLGVLPDGAAEVVYASHVLEHLSHRLTCATIEEWARVLAPGGDLLVAVPDFDRIIERYQQRGHQVGPILGPLMGEQDYEANTHRAIFNAAYLTAALEAAGFAGIRTFSPAEILPAHVWDNSRHALSLNLKARKP